MSTITNMLSSLWYDTPNKLNISNPEILSLGSMLQTVSKHIETDIKVPTLISVGSQSSGKSSVINGILSMDILPTGKNMVTRTPLKLELVQSNSNPRIEFGFYDKTMSGMPWKSNLVISLTIPIPTELEIKQVETKIMQETERLAGRSQNISMEEINMKLYSPSVPNLTLIDLPGLIQVACTDRGQPKDIKEQIIKMISNYAEQENTIIMAILVARPDLEADISLELIKQFDPDGKRTIGILTKTDLLDKGSNVSKYIDGTCSKDLKLHYGYWAIRNRGSAEMKTSTILEGFIAEDKYFNSHPTYSKMNKYSNHFGMKHLSTALTDILVKKLREILPGCISQLRELYEKTKLEMDALGAPLPEDAKGKLPIIHNFLMNFSKNFTDALESRGASFNVGRKIKEIFITYRKTIQQLQPFTKQDYPDQFIANVLQNCEGNHMSYPIPPIEVLEYCLTDERKNPYNTIMPPTYACVDKIVKSIKDLIDHLLSSPEIQRFPELVSFIQDITNEIINKQEELARTKIVEVIKMEESYIWTDDKEFRDSLQKASFNSEHKSQMEVLRSLLQNYFICTSKSIQHFVPKSIMFNFVRAIQKKLSQHLFDKLRELPEDKECQLLTEQSDQSQKRQECKERMKTLENILKSNLIQS